MQRFSEKARQALAAAQQNASHMHHAQIEVSHLLLAMVELNDSAAQKMLIGMRLKPDAIRSYLASQTGDAAGASELSPNIKRVLQFAVDASKRWRHPYIGTEHLLLALARHNHPITRDLLATAHIDSDRIRQRVESMFEAGILPEQPSQQKQRTQQDEAEEAIKSITARVIAGLEPEDWKALGRISKRIAVVMRDAVGPYMALLLRMHPRENEIMLRVLEELLKRATTEPDPDLFDPK